MSKYFSSLKSKNDSTLTFVDSDCEWNLSDELTGEGDVSTGPVRGISPTSNFKSKHDILSNRGQENCTSLKDSNYLPENMEKSQQPERRNRKPLTTEQIYNILRKQSCKKPNSTKDSPNNVKNTKSANIFALTPCKVKQKKTSKFLALSEDSWASSFVTMKEVCSIAQAKKLAASNI